MGSIRYVALAMSNHDEIFEPGMLVRCPENPEWGLGQVQSSIPGRLTVMFEHAGRLVLDTDIVRLHIEIVI